MKHLRVILCILLLVTLASPLVALAASNISGALWYGLVLVSNNSTTTTNVATTGNIGTENFIDGDFLNSSANNCAVRSSSGADIAFQPGYTDTNLWCFFVESIGANSYLSYILYTAESTGGELRYFPDTGGMTTPDDPTLELGDNWTIEQQGWVNTDNGTEKNLVYKSNAFRTYVSPLVSENITSQIFTGANAAQDKYIVNDDGEYTINTAVIWFAQTFTPTKTYPVSQIKLKLWRGAGATGTLTASIAPFNSTDNTTGDDLSVGTIDIATGIAQVAQPGAWETIPQTTVDLIAGTQYAIVLRSLDIAVSTVNWRADSTAPAYAGGSYVSSADAGVTWTVDAAVDFMFEVWDEGYIDVTATGVSSGEREVKTTNEPALDFIATNSDHFWVADHSDFSFTDGAGNDEPFSFVIWANSENMTPLNVVLSKYDAAALAREYFVFFLTDFLYINIYEVDGVKYIGRRTDSVALHLNNWMHIAVTYDGTETSAGINIYINAVDSDTTTGEVLPYTGMTDATQRFDVGSRSTGTSGFFEGKIAEIKVYSDNLTPAEVLADFNGTHKATDLVAWYRITEGAGNPLDSSGNGHHGTNVGADWVSTGLFKIFVDDTLEDFDTGATVSDNTTDWAFVENDSFAYLEYQSISVNGTQAQFIEWEYSDNFTDQSVNNNYAIPTFRGASSDPDVSANMTAFLPISEAKAPDYVLGIAPPFIDEGALTGNVTAPFTITPTTGGFPLAGVITAVANATATPSQLPLLLIAVFVILAFSLSMSAVMRKHGSGTLILKIIVIVSIMGIFIAIKNFGIDLWMLVVFLVIAIAMGMASRHQTWQ